MGNYCCAKPEVMEPPTMKTHDISTPKQGNQFIWYCGLYQILKESNIAKRIQVLYEISYFQVFKMVREYQCGRFHK